MAARLKSSISHSLDGASTPACCQTLHPHPGPPPSQGECSRCAHLTWFDLESQVQWANACPYPRAQPLTPGAVFSGLGLIQTAGFDRRER